MWVVVVQGEGTPCSRKELGLLQNYQQDGGVRWGQRSTQRLDHDFQAMAGSLDSILSPLGSP